MRYLLICSGIVGGLFAVPLMWNSNFHSPPDFQTMFGLTVMACSAISLIVGLATWEIAYSIERLENRDRAEEINKQSKPGKSLTQ